MKIKVTFPEENVEFDVEDIPDLLRLCEKARPFREEGYSRTKYRSYTDKPITMEFPVIKTERTPIVEQPAPPPPPPALSADEEVPFS